MVTYKVTAAVVATAMLCITTGVDAFWRMPCRSRTGVARMDPLVHPGGIADHSHVIHGGGDFSMDVKATELKNSDCTSCSVTQDKSAYWTPSLHFMYPNGTTVIVPQTGGMLAYYLLYGNNYDGSGKITAFPEGFQMLAGDKNLRNFTGPVPDPPTYQWTDAMQTQFSLSQKAIGFNCMNYQRTGEPTLYRHFMPDKSYLDANCVDGLRLELMFPSCWNGKDLDSADHKSHVAYPNYVMTGVCPDGFKTKLPSLLYETIWNTYAFKGVDGQFVLSYGDPLGYGYHGDFMMGWSSTAFLQQAVDTCTDLSGLIQKCPIFDIQSDWTAAECNFDMPNVLKKDNVEGPRDGLPINIPIQRGPGYATKYKIVGAEAVTTKATSAPPPASVPVVTYTPKPASSTIGSPPAPVEPATSKVTSKNNVVVASSSSTKATTQATSSVITPPPAAPATSVSTSGLKTVGTSWITKANEVIEVIIVQTYVTVTAGVPPAASPKVRRHLDHHRGHAHNHHK